jgi:hypothetical protein
MLKKKTLSNLIIATLLVMVSLSILPFVSAQQTGATLENVSTSQKVSSDPQWANHSKGAIHTIRLTAEQQNLKWKAYVGNVSSTFVLDDENDYSIYQWTMDSFSGQVYITRNNAVSWSSVSCASAENKEAEDTSLNHNSVAADSVNRTFTSQIHRAFSVGSTSIGQDTCYSTATWQDDAAPTLTPTTPFQEVLLWDSVGSSMIYATFVENDVSSYRNDGVTTYDFQAIVPDDGQPSNPALTYYFYLELN